jgi:hypothetical protein
VTTLRTPGGAPRPPAPPEAEHGAEENLSAVPGDLPILSSGLSVIGRLLDGLHREGVRYCHWKSNETLHQSLRGHVDLDLLVDAASADIIPGIVAGAGFKPLVPAPWCTYPAHCHFLALDRGTGRLAHLHIYYRLITGEGHLKGYHLPWEEMVLATRRLDAERGVYVADPHVEMVLFLVRAALKSRTYERVWRAGTGPCFRGRAAEEFRWLRARTNPLRVVELGRELLQAPAGDRLAEVLTDPSMRRFRAFRRSVIAALHPHRRYGPLEAIVHRWVKDACAVWARTSLRSFLPPAAVMGVPATGGRLIAFVGPDGSGKSTLAREVAAWLSPYLDVLPIYFGSGNGPVSLMRWPLQLISRWWQRHRAGQPSRGAPARRAGAAAAPAAWFAIARAAWALILSCEKRARLRRAWRAHERGMIVVCDRFPQNQVPGFMDGPLLAPWLGGRSRALRVLARWERSPYEWADAHPPDLVIRLDVAPEVAARRTSNMSLAEIDKRLQASRLFRYPKMTRVAVADAGGAMEDLVRRVKCLIWDAI